MQDILNYSSLFYKADQRLLSKDFVSELFSISLPKENSISSKNLFSCNDIFLQPGKEYIIDVKKNSYQLILPTAGTLFYRESEKEYKPLSNEEILSLNTSCAHGLLNIYDDKIVNFLQLEFASDLATIENRVVPLQFQEYNVLNNVFKNVQIGIFSGRTKYNYALKAAHGVFAYVINGAFEVQDRLMEHRDGLMLWQIKNIEFEALSEFAIIMLVDIELNNN